MTDRQVTHGSERTAGKWLMAMVFSIGICGPIMAAPKQPPTPSLKLSTMFSNNMVLQRGMRDPVWGWAKPGEHVEVRFGGQRRSTAAGASGRWQVRLAPMPADSKPHTLRISAGGTHIQLTNVVVGEVWLVSGQSNMQYPMAGWFHRTNLAGELAAANHPGIRFYHVPMVPSMFAGRPHLTAPAAWQVCTPKTAAGSSAVGYLFCNALHKRLGVPIGMIEADWGGTSIEAWIPAQGYLSADHLPREKRWLQKSLAAEALLHGRPAQGKTAGLINSPHGYRYHFRSAWKPDARQNPTTLFNGMISPLIPYAIRGAVWYQGENNVLAFDRHYYPKLKALITSWRSMWKEGSFPFFIVQIAPFNYGVSWCGPHKSDAPYEPLVWQAEEKAAADLPDCGIIGTMDIGDLHNIHPADKHDVGKRLALSAMAQVYGKRIPAYASPMFQSAKFHGRSVLIRFSHCPSGLTTGNGAPPTWFFLADAKGPYKPAQARLHGQTVVLTAAGILHPARVRFAWSCVAQPNLENLKKLPALPFRFNRNRTGVN